jgi:broad specificity phosphatase PhoE
VTLPHETPGPEIWLVRHGETEWSVAGRHTGRTDIPLTDAGRAQARTIGRLLRGQRFAEVLTSPLARASETARLAGFGKQAEPSNDLLEWDYGAYEGRTTAEIRLERPGWTIWRDAVPGGETAGAVGARVERVIAQARAGDGRMLVFAHAHVLRVLAARWLGLPAADGSLFALGTATVSILGWERETAVILRWNQGEGLPPSA